MSHPRITNCLDTVFSIFLRFWPKHLTCSTEPSYSSFLIELAIIPSDPPVHPTSPTITFKAEFESSSRDPKSLQCHSFPLLRPFPKLRQNIVISRANLGGFESFPLSDNQRVLLVRLTSLLQTQFIGSNNQLFAPKSRQRVSLSADHMANLHCSYSKDKQTNKNGQTITLSGPQSFRK